MKISIARKNLFQEKTRLLISVGGVAFSVMLILILLGLYRGWNEKLTRYVEEVNADVWVLQKGAADMFHSTSLFPNTTAEQIREIRGVEEVSLMVGRQISFMLNNQDAHLIVMGYDTTTGVGGPTEIIEGNNIPRSGEIIIDEVFMNAKDLNLGDTINIHDNQYNIVGISTGGNLVSFQYSFMPINDARQLLQMTDITNYALVKFAPNRNRDTIIEQIERKHQNLDVLTKQEFGENNKQQITESFLPIIYVLVVIGFVVGLAVISLTIYTATIEKSKEYGVLKAIGASNAKLYQIIFEQTAIAGIIGSIVGIGLTFVVSIIARIIEPGFVTYYIWQDAMLVFGFVAIMIIGAAYLPLRRILAIDPAIVFKE